MQILHVCDRVKKSAWTKDVGVQRENGGVDDTSTPVAPFEVGIGEAEEHLCELAFAEVVDEKFHHVRPDDRHIGELKTSAHTKWGRQRKQ